MYGSWLKIAGAAALELESELKAHSEALLTSGKLSAKEAAHVSGLEASVVSDELVVSGATLEKLRTLCMSWDIDIKPREIKSHRKIIGPVIVAVKKLAYPVLRALLHDTIQAQRHFNGTAISVLADMANSKSKESARR